MRPSGMNSMTRMIRSPEKTVWYPESAIALCEPVS
jgi:hypothetical protein